MPALKIGIQLAGLRQPLRQALQTANRLGAQAVEIDARSELRPDELSQTGLRQLRKMLDDLNLRVSALRFQTRRGYNVPAELDQRVGGTKEAMKLAQSLGARAVVNQVGRVPPESSGRDWDLLVQVLGELAVYGQHYGAPLAAETGSESGPDLARLLHALPNGLVGANLNPGNLIVNGFSPFEAAVALGPLILHVHANDGVHDLARGRGLETPLGRGAVDYPALLGALEEQNYRGYLTVARHGSDDPVFEIGQAVKYLQSL